MRVLVCGMGKIASQLLSRLGETWRVTVVDSSEDALTTASTDFPCVRRVVHGDASSPVVLEEAGLDDMRYVLALTDNDKVNLAVCGFAREREDAYVLSLVHDPVFLPRFEELSVRTVPVSTIPARSIYHYLLDPRLDVVSVAQGQGELIEMAVPERHWVVGKRLDILSDPQWRIIALFRDGAMLTPEEDTLIQGRDRLLFLGKAGVFEPVCSLMECARPQFPLEYGQSVLIALPENKAEGFDDVLTESLHVAQNTRIRRLVALCAESGCTIEDRLATWSTTLDVKILSTGSKVVKRIREVSKDENVGLVVVPPFVGSFISSLTSSAIIALAHTLPCPLLAARGTGPYKKILVAFNGSHTSRRGLEIAIDLGDQLGADLAVIVVEPPEFLHSEVDEEDWLERVLRNVRESAHVHKANVEEIIRQGNPVREIIDEAQDYNLLVISSEEDDKGLFSPDVGELLAQKSPCSVLIVT